LRIPEVRCQDIEKLGFVNLTTVTLICHCGEPLALSEAKGKRSNLKGKAKQSQGFYKDARKRLLRRKLLAMTTFLVVTYHCQIKTIAQFIMVRKE